LIAAIEETGQGAMNTDDLRKIFVQDPEKVTGFLNATLGFSLIDTYQSGEGKGAVLCNQYGDTFLLVEQATDSKTRQPIIINTPDCLQTCFHLTASGVKFLNNPYYKDESLMAEIIDPYGNQYILMEKRSILEIRNEKH
jgi:hypothetical protein